MGSSACFAERENEGEEVAKRRRSGKEEKKWQRGEEVTKRRRSDKEQKNQRAEEPKSRSIKE